MNATKKLSVQSGRESHTRLRAARPTFAIRPPSPFDDELTQEACLSIRGWWAEAHERFAGALACVEVEQAHVRHDHPVRTVIGVLEALASALYDVYVDAGDPRMHALNEHESNLGQYLLEVYAAAEQTLARLADAERRDELCMFWMLAERLSLLPRLDARPWLAQVTLDADNSLEPLLSLPANVLLLNAATTALIAALRVLARPRDSRHSTSPITAQEMADWIGTVPESCSMPTRAPDSRSRLRAASR